MSDSILYSLDEWNTALEAAENNDWDPIDAEQEAGPLAQWLCDQAYDHEKVGRDSGVIEAALWALSGRGEDEFSPERLVTVLESHQGETVDDWRTLAEQDAEEKGVELVFVDKQPTDEDYRKWYLGRQPEGEVYGGTAVGGTFHWFDSNKW